MVPLLGRLFDKKGQVDHRVRLKFVLQMSALRKFFLFVFVGKILDSMTTHRLLKFTTTIKVVSIGVKQLQQLE